MKDLVIAATFVFFLGYGFVCLFNELATVQPNVYKIVLGK